MTRCCIQSVAAWQVADGVAKVVSEAAEEGEGDGDGEGRYDVIIIDVDNKDAGLGMSCPAPEFITREYLEVRLWRLFSCEGRSESLRWFVDRLGYRVKLPPSRLMRRLEDGGSCLRRDPPLDVFDLLCGRHVGRCWRPEASWHSTSRPGHKVPFFAAIEAQLLYGAPSHSLCTFRGYRPAGHRASPSSARRIITWISSQHMAVSGSPELGDGVTASCLPPVQNCSGLRWAECSACSGAGAGRCMMCGPRNRM
jgi:hypothetical protein